MEYVVGIAVPGLSNATASKDVDTLDDATSRVLARRTQQADVADLHLRARVGTACPVDPHVLTLGEVELGVHHLGELDSVALGVDLGLSAELCPGARHRALGDRRRVLPV
jgi:hypothetical protein